MQWWNFHNQEFVVFFSMIVTILVLVIIFILSFSINTKIYQGYLKKIEEESNSTRVYIVNIKKNIVTYFNRSNMRDKRTMDLMGFYSHFHPNDNEKLHQIKAILEILIIFNKIIYH